MASSKVDWSQVAEEQALTSKVSFIILHVFISFLCDKETKTFFEIYIHIFINL